MSRQVRVSRHTISLVIAIATVIQLSSAAFGQGRRKPDGRQRAQSAIGAERARAAFDAYHSTKRPLERYDVGRPPAQPAQ
jgi:hypothetical protein